MLKKLAALCLIVFAVACEGNGPQSSGVPRKPLHRLLLLGQQNINNLSVIQSLKNHVQTEPLLENIFDGIPTNDYNRMSAMLNQHLLGFFSTPGDEFILDPDRSDFFAISIELSGYRVILDTSGQARVWFSSDTINGTGILNKEMDLATCRHQHDSLTVNSNQYQQQATSASYISNEGQGCRMNCSVTYTYTVKVLDDDRKVVRQKELTIPFDSWVIIPD